MTKLLDITRLGLLSLLSGVAVVGTGQENSNVYLYQYSHIAQSLKALDLDVEPYEVAWHLNALPDTPTASDSVVPEHRSSVTPGLPTNFEQLLWKDITPTSVLSVSQSIAFRKQRFLYPKYVYDKSLHLKTQKFLSCLSHPLHGDGDYFIDFAND
ncbi:hypothetical protein H4R35_003328 [Dimargaris xerosporica]|nr:hypothetical protein H4R35_003328 [Dimargaris xerosporica]